MLLLVPLLAAAAAAAPEPDAIDVREITALNLRAGDLAATRRDEPRPQLQCVIVSEESSCYFPITSASCANRGWDGTRTIWECSHKGAEWHLIESSEVVCERVRLDDPLTVIPGSCVLRYSLKWGPDLVFLLVVVLLFAVVGFLIYKYPPPRRNRRYVGGSSYFYHSAPSAPSSCALPLPSAPPEPVSAVTTSGRTA